MRRRLQVSVVKDKKVAATTSEPSGPTFEEKVHIVTNSVERVVKKAAWGVCAYVVLDTIRKVAVAQSTI